MGGLPVAAAAFAIAIGLTSPAQAAPAPPIEGYARCVMSDAAAARLELPRTARGEVCVVPLVRVGVEDWTPRGRAIWRWDHVGRIYTGVGVPAGELFRRPAFGTVTGYPRCIATRWAVKHFGKPRTKPGEWCAVRVIDGGFVPGTRIGLLTTTWVPRSWRQRQPVFNYFGEWVADLVRRPA